MFGRKNDAAATPATATKGKKELKPWKGVDATANLATAEQYEATAEAQKKALKEMLSKRGEEDSKRGEARKAKTGSVAPTEAERKTAQTAKDKVRQTRTGENATMAQTAEQSIPKLGKLIEDLRAQKSQLTSNMEIGKKSDKRLNGRTKEQVTQDITALRAVNKALSAALHAKADLMECQKPAAQDQQAAKMAELPAKRKAAEEARKAAEAKLKGSAAFKEVDGYKKAVDGAKDKVKRADKVLKDTKLEGKEGAALEAAKSKIEGAKARKEEGQKALTELKAKESEIVKRREELKPLRAEVRKAEKACDDLRAAKGKGKKRKPAGKEVKAIQEPVRQLETGINALKQEAAGIDRTLKAEDKSAAKGQQDKAAAATRREAQAASEQRIAERVAAILAAGGGTGTAVERLAARDGGAAEKGAGRA